MTIGEASMRWYAVWKVHGTAKHGVFSCSRRDLGRLLNARRCCPPGNKLARCCRQVCAERLYIAEADRHGVDPVVRGIWTYQEYLDRWIFARHPKRRGRRPTPVSLVVPAGVGAPSTTP